MTASPAAGVGSPKLPRRLPQVLTPEQVSWLLDGIQGTKPLELRDRALFELIYSSGLRCQEAIDLRLRDISLGSREIRAKGKGRKVRVIPVGEPAVDALDSYLREGRIRLVKEGSPHDHVFLSRTGLPLSPSDVQRRLARHWLEWALLPGPLLIRYGTPSPPISWRRSRFADDPGVAGPLFVADDPGLCPCLRGSPPQDLPPGPPARLEALGMIIDPTQQSEINEQWRLYKENGDSNARDRLILAYSPLVKYVAGRMSSGLPAHIEEGDLVSYGLLGLIGALERFDPSRNIKFETYAVSRIKGSIIDELRALDWVPRSVRSWARKVEAAVTQLENRLSRAPTDEEVAGELGVDVDEFQDILSQISCASIVALDEFWDSSGSGQDESV